MMLEDYFTKPIKQTVFKVFRGFIMGYKPISELEPTTVLLKEHVRNNGKND